MDQMMNHSSFDCLGELLPVGGGTWTGHVIPGALFLFWGIYWAQASIRRHICSQQSEKAYSSKPWYPLRGSRWLYAVEPVLKCLAAPIGLSIELYFDSKDGFRPLYCSNSGQFAQKYVHNYQHAASYPAIMVSGLVDLWGLAHPLPAGIQQVFLSMAFGIQGFLMLVHKKHTPLDAEVHELLGYSMSAVAVAILLELKAPHNFLLSAFRSLALCVQGVWMITMGQMLFTDSKAWTEEYSSPPMMAPPFFAMLVLLTSVALLLLYAGLDWWHRRCLAYTSLPQTGEERGPELDKNFVIDDDSAHASPSSSDDGRDSMDGQGKPAKQRYQLKTALGKLHPPSRLPTRHSASKSSEHIV